MKRVKVTLLLFVLIGITTWSQQDPLSSNYMFSTLTYNPGVAGTSGMICATAIARQQWVGFTGAPATTTFNVSAAVSPFRVESGIGLMVESDQVGFDSDINISGIYALLVNMGTGKLGIGVNLGVMNKTLDPEWHIPSGDGFTPPDQDPLIPVNKESFVVFDAGFGLYYNADNYYAGLSVRHLNQARFRFTKGEPYLTRHYYLTAGYNLQLPNPALELLPSVFAFSDGRALQASVTTMLRYNKKVWGGVSYRAGDALTGIAGIELFNGIRIGYAYDFPVSDIRKNTMGSHELMVNYCFDLRTGKSRTKYKSIRFL
ncbi:MAG TPA: type IX secretion system membrane protein PorP/SprF [Bacteroidales bacterium]|jgi:type IX secretion system PorP/SprF family membrane protein|nr:type IX secretion system membrane protein PorP/SprF [Bacteroidales bacterium]HQH23797.1 type IX secretion system membrane protein PorP/SprF [Bacteroidales bacterium]HQJ81622.1 type IX secretion system membrane protein PorP/SprF [Bacteroidales bacterium]